MGQFNKAGPREQRRGQADVTFSDAYRNEVRMPSKTPDCHQFAPLPVLIEPCFAFVNLFEKFNVRHEVDRRWRLQLSPT
jgi:hypothetical protein